MHPYLESEPAMRLRLVLALLASTALLAFAEAPPAVTHPQVVYRPVLADYAPYREGELLDWRAVNDLVARLGGHMGHTEQAAHRHEPAAAGVPTQPAAGGQAPQRP